MFGGFGGFGGQDPNQNQQPGGFPGMNMNVNMTTTTTTGGGAPGASASMSGFGGAPGGAGGQGDPGKQSQEMQDRYKHRERKLPTYIALVDFLESQGENVSILKYGKSFLNITVKI